MANYNFNLKDCNLKKTTPVILIIRYSKQKIVFYTRESIPPDYWNKDTQRAKQSKQFPEYPEFNQRLSNIEATAKDVFRRYQNDHDHREPAPAEYKKLLEAAIKGTKSGIPTNFYDFAGYFINLTKKRLETEKKAFLRGGIAGSYNQTLVCIKDFAKEKNKRIDFDTFDMNFYSDFVEYMETVKRFKLNTIGKHIKNLKRILSEAGKPEMNVNKFTFYKAFKVKDEEVSSIYLNESELQAMYELDLSNNPRLDKVRDLFLIGAWTGLRFSDFTSIPAKDIQGDFIHIQTQKTGQKVVIPIHQTIKTILSKYKGQSENSLPPEISNPNMNAYLKEVGKKLDVLNINSDVSYTKAGKKIQKKQKKYELLTSHSARRSFATNMYLAGVPSITIMAITGHRTEKAFLTYIRVTPDEHAKILMGYFQKQNKLRVV